MLAAYYSKGADSDSLFQNLKISKMDNYKENLNQYDVLFLDVAWFISIASSIENTVSEMQDSIIEELKSAFPDIIGPSVHSLPVAVQQPDGSFLLLLMNGMPCFVKLQMMKKFRNHIFSCYGLYLRDFR